MRPTTGPSKAGKLTQFEGGIQSALHDEVERARSPPARVTSTPFRPPTFTQRRSRLQVACCQMIREYDGVNSGSLRQQAKNKERPHDALFWRADHIWAIRDGDYKLILSTRDGWAELYNLITDQSEKINLKRGRCPSSTRSSKKSTSTWQEGEAQSDQADVAAHHG